MLPLRAYVRRALPDVSEARVSRLAAELPGADCAFCGGFYGPSHGQALCGPCHDFAVETPEPRLWRRVRYPDEEAMDEGKETRGNEALWSFSRDSLPLPPGYVESQIPPELLNRVFRALDDLSLGSAAMVNRRWSRLIRSRTNAAFWEEKVSSRWPLFRPRPGPLCWLRTHRRLSAALPCLRCAGDRDNDVDFEEDALPIRRLKNELRMIDEWGLADGVSLHSFGGRHRHWQGAVMGPAGTPYEGGRFFVSVVIPLGYPMAAPLVRFRTRVLHPFVSRHGDVGLDLLRDSWPAGVALGTAVLALQALLAEPAGAGVVMEPGLGRLCREEPEIFRILVQWYTLRYAMTELGM